MTVIPEGCDLCPNRKKYISFTYVSKRNAFAAVLTLILLSFVFELSDGRIKQRENPDLATITGLITVIAGVLELKISSN